MAKERRQHTAQEVLKRRPARQGSRAIVFIIVMVAPIVFFLWYGARAQPHLPSQQTAKTPPLPRFEPLDPKAAAELNQLKKKVARFKLVLLTKNSGDVRLNLKSGITIEDLRGVALEENPPTFRSVPPAYPADKTDGLAPRGAPYVAKDIRPFRLTHFNSVFHYAGAHNWAMQDYVALHGFNVLVLDGRTPEEAAHLPEHVRFQTVTNGIDWAGWLKKRGMPADQFGQLVAMDLIGSLIEQKAFARESGHDFLSIRPRFAFSSPEKLREKEWFSKIGSVEERGAAESEYYAGCAKSATAMITAARRAGWKNVEIRWQPLNLGPWKVDTTNADPKGSWFWNRIGAPLGEVADAFQIDMRLTYWRQTHIAATLAELDLNREYVETATRKPRLRPRYHPFVAAGGRGWRWWNGKAIPNEDLRAMITFALFSGVEGIEYYVSSGKGNHHRPSVELKAGQDVMLAGGFELKPIDAEKLGGAPYKFKRYDVLHIHEVTADGMARFQKVHKWDSGRKHRVQPGFPEYWMQQKKLVERLRPASDVVAGLIEGLALAKPFEYILRHGEVKIDVPSQKQFNHGSPIVRRVKLGRLHVLATYDPTHPRKPRQIALTDFDGHKGLTLWLPADGQVRVFVIEEKITPTSKPKPKSAYVSSQKDPAEAEIDTLVHRVKGFKVLRLPKTPGEVRVGKDFSLTIGHLRGVSLDDNPPVLKKPERWYPRRKSDGLLPGYEPYVAEGIAPFRFRYFNCEFNYGGWHNFKMADYASTHGFNIISTYTRKVSEGKHLPQGTLWLTWGGFVNWHKWFKEHGLPDGRYDLLMDRDVVAMHLQENRFKRDPKGDVLKLRGDLLMIDQEHGVLKPDKLREQSWYPQDASPAEKEAFEKKYYDGYAMTYLSSVRAARQQGWKNISIYGWYPYGRTWGGLEQVEAEPGTDFAWNAFGKKIFKEIDIVNNSVYCFYWSPGNVAYTLANVDANIKMTGNLKPVRPYYWTLLHGGGDGWRWWKEQPLPNEEKRAIIAMAFFTGIDGFVTWNWSHTGTHHRASLRRREKIKNPKPGEPRYRLVMNDVMVGRDFTCRSEKGEERTFKRYDALHITSVDEETQEARFQLIEKGARGRARYGVRPDRPYYRLPRELLLRHLRAKSEPVAAMIEGMALVKPLEYMIRHGEVKIDVDAREQWKKTLPVVRRVKYKNYHILITYDPNVIYGGQPRDVVLSDFGGVKGRTLRLAADEQTRIYVLKEE